MLDASSRPGLLLAVPAVFTIIYLILHIHLVSISPEAPELFLASLQSVQKDQNAVFDDLQLFPSEGTVDRTKNGTNSSVFAIRTYKYFILILLLLV